MILVDTFNLIDTHNWPLEDIVREGQACTDRRQEYELYKCEKVELVGSEDIQFEGKPAKQYTFNVFGEDLAVTPEEIAAVQEARQDDTLLPVRPFEEDADSSEQITVRMLRDMLSQLSPDMDGYAVKFDSACGGIMKGDFTIYPRSAEISING